MSDQRPRKPREAQAEHIQAESQPASSPCPPPHAHLTPNTRLQSVRERQFRLGTWRELMEDGLGRELRLFTPGDEVWEVPEESAQEEGSVWRRTWGLEHMLQAMWVTD